MSVGLENWNGLPYFSPELHPTFYQHVFLLPLHARFDVLPDLVAGRAFGVGFGSRSGYGISRLRISDHRPG